MYEYLNEDGDSDYCPDTYSFDYGFYPSVFKANNLDGQPENDQLVLWSISLRSM